ncbi:EAL domain-containing protein [Formivibrio citricus]|uniref:EAL domain-containing protein n=1 Tax=Formivibrio citricus TaxID=83765 RepID=UPI000B866782|nr:EAL domain-containing protein [Formivibrio citricus]
MSGVDGFFDEGDELLKFEDEIAKGLQRESAEPWHILIVDDDEDVHQATEFALNGVFILDRPLNFLHAYSAKEALDILRQKNDIAVILLDVVMESENAGLVAVGVIRDELGLANPRIVLRTGQPGYAPEIETIRRYDINDYKTKNELTRSKLYTTLTAAVRSFDQLLRLDASRKGLEQIVLASNQLIMEKGVKNFSSGVIMQMAALVGVKPEGMVCACAENNATLDQCTVLAATGMFSALIGHRLADIDEPRIKNSLARCLSEHRNLVEEDHMVLFFAGHNLCDFAAFIDSNIPLREIDHHLLEVFCTNIAICGDNVKLVEKLRDLAYIDPILNLPNRSYFIEAIERALAEGRVPQVVALLDVDQFAEINDMFGYHYGDLLLDAIARRLERRFGGGAVIARISNDTFAIFGDAVEVNPESMQPLLNPSFNIEGVERPVSMSAGFVHAKSGDDGATLLKNASIAIKRAKECGLGQFAWYSPDVAAASRERVQLLQDLRQALKQEMLYLVYQPQIDLNTKKVVGVEALMRWCTAEEKFISPELFVSVAEQSGLIINLGMWALRTALHAVRHIQDRGYTDIRMAVNVSTNQLRQANFVEEVNAALCDSGVNPEMLELEITESVAVLGYSFVEKKINVLRGMGISIAIDDFGTGYSSLSYLGRLPVNRLKIDRSFILSLASDINNFNIPQMVVLLGHQLNMKVIAEGVETGRQVEVLRQIGCDEAQGFLYARGMTLSELLPWLDNQ